VYYGKQNSSSSDYSNSYKNNSYQYNKDILDDDYTKELSSQVVDKLDTHIKEDYFSSFFDAFSFTLLSFISS
jgi:hypothetical protein